MPLIRRSALVGGGRGYERGLRRMARSLGVAEAITFAGPREHDELPPFYDAADAVALPSLFEGLPLVLLEAMAAARPVVATAVGGIPDLVEDGRTGRLVAPGDPAALAAALAGVAADPEAARRLGAAARERVVEGNSWEAIARRYLHVIGRSTADRIDGPPREKVS